MPWTTSLYESIKETSIRSLFIFYIIPYKTTEKVFITLYIIDEKTESILYKNTGKSESTPYTITMKNESIEGIYSEQIGSTVEKYSNMTIILTIVNI